MRKSLEWYLNARAMQGMHYEPDNESQCTSSADIDGVRRALMPRDEVNTIRCIASGRQLGRVHARYMLEYHDYKKGVLRMQRLPEDKLGNACRVANEINSRYDIGSMPISHNMFYPCLEVDYVFTGDALSDGHMLQAKETRTMMSFLTFVPLVCMACADDVDLPWVLGLVEDACDSLPGLTHKYDLYMHDLVPDGVSVVQSQDDLKAKSDDDDDFDFETR
jgi:hypothetical protein